MCDVALPGHGVAVLQEGLVIPILQTRKLRLEEIRGSLAFHSTTGIFYPKGIIARKELSCDPIHFCCHHLHSTSLVYTVPPRMSLTISLGQLNQTRVSD